MSDASLTFTVTDDDTAAALGSGCLPVLGTPRLLAWCEAATCAAIEPELGEGETSVGTRVTLEHTRGSRVGVRLVRIGLVRVALVRIGLVRIGLLRRRRVERAVGVVHRVRLPA